MKTEGQTVTVISPSVDDSCPWWRKWRPSRLRMKSRNRTENPVSFLQLLFYIHAILNLSVCLSACLSFRPCHMVQFNAHHWHFFFFFISTSINKFTISGCLLPTISLIGLGCLTLALDNTLFIPWTAHKDHRTRVRNWKCSHTSTLWTKM